MIAQIPNRSLDRLRGEFRHHLEQFYASLNLAPPYHSLEKAIRLLSSEGQRKSPQELQKLIDDSILRWKFYEEIFGKSGLAQKHRGIIKGLIESDKIPSLPDPYGNFLAAFQEKTKGKHEQP